ncbi:MAG: methyl-accepting chemotaxis protein [Desulfobacteraceae bacterium]|nr:methyl-accepting chemotaxis protein [Desulfobacteraceae bacterium]
MSKKDSLGFKLMVGGILVVLLPIIVLGYFSVNKASDSVMEISKNQVKGIAEDLASITRNAVESEFITAQMLADKNLVINAFSLKEEGNAEELDKSVKLLNSNLLNTLKNMGKHYEGIFMSDAQGNIFAGIMQNGTPYGNINISDRDYFKKAVSSGKASMGELIKSRVSSDVVGVISVPVKNKLGKLMGVSCLTIKVDYFTTLISGRKIGKTGYGYMANKKGLVLSHPVEKHILSLNMNDLDGIQEFKEKMLSGNSGTDDYYFYGVYKISGYAPVGLNDWYIAATQDADEFLSAPRAIRNFILVTGIVSVLIAAFFIYIVSKAIINPVNKAVNGLKDIAQGEGDLRMRLEVKTKDEIGQLCIWFNTFMGKMQEMIKEIAENSNEVANSSTELSAVSSEMTAAAENVSSKSQNVSAASEEMTANINDVAAAMEQSSTNINMVASAAEEMNSTINEIAQSTEKARSISNDAVEKSANASIRMAELGKAAQSIGEVTETITDISQQTNLLSLNATIEAARAGEAGKGFAVVANEIKELSVQTAKATLDIKGKIEEVQSSVSMSVEDIDEIKKVIGDVNDIVATIAAAVEEQSSATTEITRNISEASQAVEDVNQRVNQNADVANQISSDITSVSRETDEISSGIGQIKISSEILSEMSGKLNAIVSRFKV